MILTLVTSGAQNGFLLFSQKFFPATYDETFTLRNFLRGMLLCKFALNYLQKKCFIINFFVRPFSVLKRRGGADFTPSNVLPTKKHADVTRVKAFYSFSQNRVQYYQDTLRLVINRRFKNLGLRAVKHYLNQRLSLKYKLLTFNIYFDQVIIINYVSE